MHLNGENCLNMILGAKHAGNGQIDRTFMCLKTNLSPGGWLPLPRGYIHIYDHNIQTSSPLKLLGQSKPNFIFSIVRKGQ